MPLLLSSFGFTDSITSGCQDWVGAALRSKLMEDLCVHGEETDILPEAHYDAPSDAVFVDSCGFYSSLDGFLSILMSLTCHISNRLICFIEDLILRDVEWYSENFLTSARETHTSSSSLDNCTFDRESQCEVINPSYCCQGASFIIQGLTLPLFGLRLIWRLALASWRCILYYITNAQLQVHSITSRIQKTLRGSSDDIGWLQCTPGLAPVVDGTARFLELLENIRNGEHTLPDSYVYLLIPGLFSNHGPLYFVATKKFFSKMGLACHIARIHSEASVEHNAWELKHYIEELYWGSGKRVMLLGHSKGGVDAAAALSVYWPDLKEKVAGLALVQSPYGGTPIASDILREGQVADKETRRIMELVICKIIKGDIRALEDLTYDKRREFITKHKLPDQIPLISFHSEASIAPGVLATMTHIAHAELPWLPLPNFGSEESQCVFQAGCQVPVVIPISAAMAVCALHLQLRYGEKSDGLVTCRDAEVPGSVVVRPDRKLDHAWMVYSSRKSDSTDPDSCEMCEALLTMLVELGKTKSPRDNASYGSQEHSSS